ncbi:hypothetical protein [Agrobacterium larrymoorei]|uniref:Uncharacterized protein n=1 Tax=Agrobacterium larrymoorei TaxID=160699 RepID=A0AAF0HAY4_9HYPH|nr:hypothetical protein [Agrobacterium larrymoorei]WHA40941.1 hypothetical protein CFBP5477_014195 [Agrobacterium larrymoorei]
MLRISPMIETPPTVHQIRTLQTIVGVCVAALIAAIAVTGGF